MKNNIITIILVFFTSSLFAGGPWPQPKGKGYFKLSEWWTVFDQHYTDNGMIDPNLTTGIYNTTFYGEYGITDRFTAVVNAPLFSRTYMNNLRSRTTDEIIIPGESLNGIGDIDLAVKYGLSNPGSPIPISVTLGVGIPTGNPNGGSQGNLQTGDGEFNQSIQVDAGKSFKLFNKNAYLSSYAGVNNRTNNFSEEFRYGVELGVGLFNQKLWLAGKVNGIKLFKNGATAETVTSTSLFANNTEFTSIALDVNYYVSKRVGVSVSYATAINGAIIAAAPAYSVGVFYDMK